MANNPYVNKVQTADGNTLMDITDTTAQTGDVLEGKVFYAASGQRSIGALGDFTGATASADGTHGLVPAPEAGEEAHYLRGDGTWQDFNNLQLDGYVVKNDSVMTGTISRGRVTNSTYGTGSVAVGFAVVASGQYAHAEGSFTTASGESAHSEGRSTQATGQGAHAEGITALASGSGSHAEGYGGTGAGALGKADHAEGYHTLANSGSANNVYAAHAEGYQTSATANAAHAEGANTAASGYASHASGVSTAASGYGSHAEGGWTVSSASYGHAEGYYTNATGGYGHAEGQYTKASGASSHAEGYYASASGNTSHAEGYQTKANGSFQHVSGVSNYAIGDRSFSIPPISEVEEYDTTKDLYVAGSVVKVDGEIWVAHNNAYVRRSPPAIDTVNWHSVSSLPAGVTPNEWETLGTYAQNTYVKVTANGAEAYYQNHNEISSPTVIPGVGSEGTIHWHNQNAGTMAVPYAMEIIGNGPPTYSTGANIRMLDVYGNEYLRGDVYVGCNIDSTGGTKLTPLPEPPSADGTYTLRLVVSGGVPTYSWVSA